MMQVFLLNLYLLSVGGKSGFVKNEFKKAIEVAKTVMGRRNVEDRKTIEIYKKIHDIIDS